MGLQRWWEEFERSLWYHITHDEAYLRHHFRKEVTRNLQDIIRGQKAQMALQAQIGRAQIEALERGFSALGRQVEDLADTISWSMSAVGDAISDLESTMVQEFQETRRLLSWGFAELIWQQEQTNKLLLLEVLAKLSHPRTAEAEEMRERGNEFYKNALNARRPEDKERWINLALDAYLEAVRKNPADFSVFYSLGVIMFFEKGNSELAVHCFREAASLAEPYSPYHAAMAWLHLGYVHRNRNELEKAYQATEEAVRLQPDWLEAHYQHAVHCALTGRMDEMRRRLAEIIERDETYFPKAATDPDLLPFREVQEVLDEALQKATQRSQTLQAKLARWQKVLSNLRVYLPEEQYLQQALHLLQQALHLLQQALHLLQQALHSLQQAQNYVALRQAIPQAEDTLHQLPKMLSAFVQSLRGHNNAVTSVSFSPDGQFLASGSYDKTIKLWRVYDGSLIRTIKGHNGGVTSVSFSPDGQFLASGSYDETIKLWRVYDGSLIRTIEGHNGGVTSVFFSPDGKFLASGSDDKTIKLWRVYKSEAEMDQLLHDLEAEARWREQLAEQLAREEEERQRIQALKAQRREQGLCEECGRPLSFWDKLLSRTKCASCR